jgi:hypothetical protein
MNTIYNEIKDEFGVEATSAYYKTPVLPVRIAQRINNKYPSEMGSSRFTTTLNPKAVLIAKRYLSLVMGVK